MPRGHLGGMSTVKKKKPSGPSGQHTTPRRSVGMTAEEFERTDAQAASRGMPWAKWVRLKLLGLLRSAAIVLVAGCSVESGYEGFAGLDIARSLGGSSGAPSVASGGELASGGGYVAGSGSASGGSGAAPYRHPSFGDGGATAGQPGASVAGSGSGGAAGSAGTGGAPKVGNGGEPACFGKTVEQLCGALNCGPVSGLCGETVDCGTCSVSEDCVAGRCETKPACECGSGCGVYAASDCPVAVTCASCEDGDVCTESIGQGRICFKTGFAGSCDGTVVPNPNGFCGDMCLNAKAGCEKPYYDCGRMFANDGSPCPSCSGVAIGRWQCGPG